MRPIEWYTSIGFTLIRQNEGDDEINWAKLSFGNSELMLNVGGKPSTEQRREVDLYITTDNVDDLYRRLQPHFSNQAKLAEISETFSIGVMPFASMGRKDNTGANQRSEAGPYRSVVSANAERCAASDEEASHFGAEEPEVIFWGAWNRREVWRRPEALVVHLRGVGRARCSCQDPGQRRQRGSIRWNRFGRSR